MGQIIGQKNSTKASSTIDCDRNARAFVNRKVQLNAGWPPDACRTKIGSLIATGIRNVDPSSVIPSYAGGTVIGHDNDLQYLIALSMIDGVGPLMGRGLIAHYGSAKAVFIPNREKDANSPGIMRRVRNASLQYEMLKAAEREIAFALKNEVQILSLFDEKYPAKLKAIADSPLVLYGKGSLDKFDQIHIAVVGTRRPTSYGRKVAAEFARRFGEVGVTVVSGLAYGIDIEAHRSTIQAGGRTVAVLGHGIDQVYPKDHYGEANRILATGGVLLTEYCSGVGPESYNFPSRNRIISGLSDAVLVVEANETGGALITAKMAFDQDRDVYAIPGCVGMERSLGCNRLIRDNIAKIACSPDEILQGLEHLFGQFPAPKMSSQRRRPQLSESEEAVYSMMDSGAIAIEEIVSASGFSEQIVLAAILGMELRGIVSKVAGNKYEQIG